MASPVMNERSMSKHPNKEIRAAVDYALANGWRLVEAGSHSHIWGTLLCSHADRSGCRKAVYCTPRNPQNHAKDIRRAVDGCPH